MPTKVTDPNGNVTSGKYDGLGRLVVVWEPGRVQGSDTANTTFAYTVRDTGVNAVTTKTLNHDASAYLTSTSILDGLLRDRQTQSPSADRDNPGRVVTDTLYDTRGMAHITYDRWFVTGGPATTMVYPTTGSGDDEFKFVVPSSTVTRFDGAGRATAVIERSGADERWRTTTSYRGDRTLVNPPTGGTPTMEITDARGNVVELHQYLGASPSGTSQLTKYTYDAANRLTKVTDPSANTWTYSYDLRGRQTAASDPDKGASSSTYDDAGQVTSTTDARGEKLAHVYDALGRKTATRDDTATGALRSSWSYDTHCKGCRRQYSKGEAPLQNEELRLKSRTPGRAEVDNARWLNVHQNKLVQASMWISNKPLVKRAGWPGIIIGWGWFHGCLPQLQRWRRRFRKLLASQHYSNGRARARKEGLGG